MDPRIKAAREGIPWTEPEDRIVQRSYRTLGAKITAERLKKNGFHRTVPAVWRRATRLGIYHEPAQLGYRWGKVEDMVYLSEALPTANRREPLAHKRIIEAAKDAGVLVRADTYPYKYMAPQSWVDDYMDRLSDELQMERETYLTWATSKETAAKFGIKYRTLVAYTCNYTDRRGSHLSIFDHLEKIPTRKIKYGKHRGLYYEPNILEKEAEKYRLRKENKTLRLYTFAKIKK